MDVRRAPGLRQPALRAATALLWAALAVASPLAGQEPEAAVTERAAADSTPCFSATTTEVVGFVSDSASGTMLAGARVSVSWDEADPQGLIGESDAEGLYQLCDVPTGVPLVMTSTFPGRRAEATLTLPEGRQAVRVDFELAGADARDAIPVDPIEVRAPREEEEARRKSGEVRYRVTREQLAARPAESVVEIVRARVPGLRVRYDRWGCPVFVAREGPTLVVVDGVLMGDGGCSLQSFTADDIESVEVLSALAASMRFGSIAGGGVIEITTRRR